MTATQTRTMKTSASKIYRAKVTGRHAITLPAELCRILGIEVGDSVDLEVKGDGVELRPVRPVEVIPVSELRGIMKGMFRDWDDIQAYVKELRDEWEDDPELDGPLTIEQRSKL